MENMSWYIHESKRGFSHVFVNTYVLFILLLNLLRGRCVLCLVLHLYKLTFFFVLLSIVSPKVVWYGRDDPIYMMCVYQTKYKYYLFNYML